MNGCKTKVVKENPPAPTKGPSVWEQRLTKVAKEPGEWFRVFVGSPRSVHVIATHLRKGDGKYAIPDALPGKFTIASRVVGNEGRVYVKYDLLSLVPPVAAAQVA